ncbi:PD-(D/E)XK nuclease family protein [SAR202 cluster bacterium AC-647-N09_OGT_505m]|nr:PD-(D/E)XK nuclease family protein [SAR202 cluster bacterium AC-647-N09_OGT_505m]
MISLKRNNKGVLVSATGLRSRDSSIYVPGQTRLFRISRSKFNDFLTCKRCFYLDRVRGLVSPSTPGWTLNETTDLLLKKEFDLCREKQIPHRLFEEHGLNGVVPFMHEDLDMWRDSLHHGLQHHLEHSNIVLHGGIDDVWFDRLQEKLIVVDYKSQASSRSVDTNDYLAGVYHQSYKVQLDFYAYLLIKMGFDVSPVGYFYVCNADRSAPAFNGQMRFQETLVPYEWNIDWIHSMVWKMIDVLNSYDIPEHNSSCENCAYAHQRALIEV